MPRLIRSLLLKVPVIQRQMARIAELEASSQRQQIQLQLLERAVRQSPESSHFEVVSSTPTLPESRTEPLLEQIAARDQALRLLRVGHGATFEELETAGKVGGGKPYQFEDLISIQQVGEQLAASTPPLVFLHVPKAGGTTINNILMKNYRYRLDSYGPTFFPPYYPDQFVSLVQPPLSDDTRRPVYFTGHIDIDNDVFRYMPVRYVATTMLRDPTARIVSHYRFHSTLPGSRLADAIHQEGLDIVEYFRRFRTEIPLQYEIFSPRKSGNEISRVHEALRNLDSKISFFGLQERYDEFAVLLQSLLGLPDVFYSPLNKTPSNAAPVTPDQINQLRALLIDDVRFHEGATQLYERRMRSLAFDMEARLKSFRETKKLYVDLREKEVQPHPWRSFYS